MRSVAQILEVVDTVAPLARAAGWDPVGLQLGDPSASAGRVGVCHEVTPEVVAAATAADLDVLISYHPLLFRPTTRIVAGSGPAGRAYELLRRGVAVIVVHTAADANAGGCADSLAEILGLADVRPFAPLWPADASKIITFVPAADVGRVRDAMAATGAGVIGRYSSCSFETSGRGSFVPGDGAAPVAGVVGHMSHEDEVRLEMIAPAGRVDAAVAALVSAHPYDEAAYDVVATRSNAGFLGRYGALTTTVDSLAELVADRLGSTPRVAGAGEVTSVAVIPGSGGDFVEAAASVADVVVTGDVSHHRARAALDHGCAVIDPGHAATERPGVASLYASLAAELGSVVDLTEVPASPWKDA